MPDLSQNQRESVSSCGAGEVIWDRCRYAEVEQRGSTLLLVSDLEEDLLLYYIGRISPTRSCPYSEVVI
jgi:hypothetical protein